MTVTIGKKLQKLRKQIGMSQQELADYLSVARQTIGKWEQDLSLPDVETLMEIADLFKISLNELIGVEEKNNQLVPLTYPQMQTIVDNLQKQNKKRNLFELILILICIFCLLSTNLRPVNKASAATTNKPDIPNQNLTMDSIYDFFDTPILNQYLTFSDSTNTWERDYYLASHFNVSSVHLARMEMTIDYRLVLKEYSEDTQVSISFLNGLDYQFEKIGENNFHLKQTIPLLDYETIYLKFRDIAGKTTVEKVEDVNYLTAFLKNQILLYFRAYNHQLEYDKLYYQPIGLYKNKYLPTLNGTLHGDLTVRFFDENHQKIGDSITIDLFQKGSYPLTEPLYPNKKIYIELEYNVGRENEKYYYSGTLHETSEKEQRDSYFIIDDTSQDYDIMFQLN